LDGMIKNYERIVYAVCSEQMNTIFDLQFVQRKDNV